MLDAQQRLRERLEAEPVRFFSREYPALLDSARAALARFVGAAPEDLAFVPNATTGINTVLRSLRLGYGDEILVTDHAYNACRNAVEYAVAVAGAVVRVARVPFPLTSPDDVIEAVIDAVTPQTRLAVLDHVTSPTGLRFPIAELVGQLDARGIDTLVDGAHAPGMLAVDLRALGAAYYAANCHKWLCAPKGAAFLHVRADRQNRIRPLSISHGANAPRSDRSRFLLEFDWTGTHDPSAYLVVPDAIRVIGSLLPGGWTEVMATNRALALTAREVLAAALGVAPPCPETMIGSLATLPLPDRPAGQPLGADRREPLHDDLLDRFAVQVPIFAWPAPPKRLVRISAQLYNDVSDYARLADALRAGLADESRSQSTAGFG